jgi:hypothetical protein
MPALIIGIEAMRDLGVSARLWGINIAATGLGVVIWMIVDRFPPLARRGRTFVTALSIGAILLPFASPRIEGVYRWVAVAGLRLHAAAIVAPLLIACVAAAHGIRSALMLSAASAIILALQPDAAQTTSFAAASACVLVLGPAREMHKLLSSLALLLLIACAAFIRRDPLPPVRHVEEIFGVLASRGPGWAAIGTVALLLLPLPFFAAWFRYRNRTALGLGVYVAMTLLAPAWGTFPVPVMGLGASPILGYFIALAVGFGAPERPRVIAPIAAEE